MSQRSRSSDPDANVEVFDVSGRLVVQDNDDGSYVTATSNHGNSAAQHHVPLDSGDTYSSDYQPLRNLRN